MIIRVIITFEEVSDSIGVVTEGVDVPSLIIVTTCGFSDNVATTL